MEDFFKQQRRMNMFYDAFTFVGIAFGIFIIICKIILIAVK
jgi:hypothetical protein